MLGIGRSSENDIVKCSVRMLKERDISKHILCFNTLFEKAVADNRLLTTLSLDCSKGFNRLSHSWLRRVLVAAQCPQPLIDAVMELVVESKVSLTYRKQRYRRIPLFCGLPQGGPLSPLLFVLCVEPLLSALEQHSDVELTLGFVDDWLASTFNLSCIPDVQRICDIFARASGLVINFSKTVILVS